MKKILILLLVITFASCSSSPYEPAIRNHLKQQALGFNLHPKFKSITVIDTVTIDDEMALVQIKSDEVEKTYIKMKQNLEREEQTNADGGNSEEIKRMKGWVNLLESINKKKKGVDFYVVNALYTIKNPLVNAEQELNQVFFIRDSKVIGNALSDAVKGENDKDVLNKYMTIVYNN